MFALRRRKSIIAEGLRIEGSASAEGLVEIDGEVESELHLPSATTKRHDF
jgi:cytoskeletal protein CcmA (bactofilin family)